MTMGSLLWPRGRQRNYTTTVQPSLRARNPYIRDIQRSVPLTVLDRLQEICRDINKPWIDHEMFVYQSLTSDTSARVPRQDVQVMSAIGLQYGIQFLMEVMRGQTAQDYRPNKELQVDLLRHLLSKYRAQLGSLIHGRALDHWSTMEQQRSLALPFVSFVTVSSRIFSGDAMW